MFSSEDHRCERKKQRQRKQTRAGWKEIGNLKAFKKEGKGDLVTNIILIKFYRLKDKMAVWEAEDVSLPAPPSSFPPSYAIQF